MNMLKHTRFSDMRTLYHNHGKWICAFFCACSLLCAVFWALYYSYTGSIPHMEKLNLVWWSWTLPFPLSRLTDLVLGPLYALLFLFYSTFGLFYASDADTGMDSQLAPVWLYIFAVGGQMLSFFIGCIFGFLYGILVWPLLSLVLFLGVVLCAWGLTVLFGPRLNGV